jgi:hypothetical protein
MALACRSRDGLQSRIGRSHLRTRVHLWFTKHLTRPIAVMHGYLSRYAESVETMEHFPRGPTNLRRTHACRILFSSGVRHGRAHRYEV